MFNQFKKKIIIKDFEWLMRCREQDEILDFEHTNLTRKRPLSKISKLDGSRKSEKSKKKAKN